MIDTDKFLARMSLGCLVELYKRLGSEYEENEVAEVSVMQIQVYGAGYRKYGDEFLLLIGE